MKNLPSVALCFLFLFTYSLQISAQPYTPSIDVSSDNGASYPNSLPLSGSSVSGLKFELDYSHDKSYEPLDFFWSLDHGYYSWEFRPDNNFTKNNNTIKIWVVDDYDDDIDPMKSVQVIGGLGLNLSGTTKKAQPAINNGVEIKPSWSRLMYGDTVMYVVRVSNKCETDITGDLTFKVNSTGAFNLKNSFVQDAGVFNTANDEVTWPNVTIPKDEYRDHMVGYDLKESKNTNTNIADVEATFNIKKGPRTCETFTETTTKQDTIGDSHDPNFKITVRPTDEICIDETTGNFTVEYKVEFQNVGEKYATKVTIEDWLDMKGDIMIINGLTGYKYDGLLPNPTIHKDAAKGYVRWHFDYPANKLRGRKEPMYMVNFTEPNTRDWFTFSVEYSKDALNTLGGCSALMNQVRITFDCNTELYTNSSFAPIACVDIPPGCPDCTEEFFPMPLDTLVLDTINNTFKLPSQVVSDVSGLAIHWYPDRWISDISNAAAIMSPLENITYMMVASDACNRRIYTIPIKVDNHGRKKGSPIYILDDDDPNDCTCTPVIIGGSPPYTYAWTGGTSGPSIYSFANGKFSLTLTDAHGCTSTFTTKIKCTGGGKPWWLYGIIGIVLFLIIGIILKRIRINSGGG